jgi:hypothetical protein
MRASPTIASPDDTSLTRLSLLDWIGVVLVASSGVLSLVVPLTLAPMFRRLSESLGAPPGTGVGLLQGWIPVVLGVAPLVLVAWALGVRQSLLRRRLILVVAFALTVLAGAVSLFALYGALFSMAAAPTG